MGAVSAVDPRGGRRVIEGLVPHDVAEVLLEQTVDPVDAEVPAGAEDVEVPGQQQVVVLVAGEATTLEVDDKGVRCEP